MGPIQDLFGFVALRMRVSIHAIVGRNCIYHRVNLPSHRTKFVRIEVKKNKNMNDFRRCKLYLLLIYFFFLGFEFQSKYGDN